MNILTETVNKEEQQACFAQQKRNYFFNRKLHQKKHTANAYASLNDRNT